jgi:hypothetical protein
MRFFALVDFQYEAMAVFLGLVTAILVYLAWGGYPKDRRTADAEDSEQPGGGEPDIVHHDEDRPIAPFLLFLYIGIPLWSLAYMIYTGFFGPRF